MSHVVFVYGTLKKNFSNHTLLVKSHFLGSAHTAEKYALYVTAIPFVIKDEPISHIHGELYEVCDSTLARLDYFEGHPDHYMREQIKVVKKDRQDAEEITAWIYFYPEKMGRLINTGIYKP